MINKLREMNEKLIALNKNDEKYQLIKKLLRDDKCFFKIDINTAFSVLKDIGIEDKDIKDVYENLIDIKNYY